MNYDFKVLLLTNQNSRRVAFTWKRWKSEGLKSLGEHPHQSTMCLYWHLQPSLRFQLVMRRLLSTMLSQWALFSSTVWKNDWEMRGKNRRRDKEGKIKEMENQKTVRLLFFHIIHLTRGNKIGSRKKMDLLQLLINIQFPCRGLCCFPPTWVNGC